jgi:hypothetical protein
VSVLPLYGFVEGDTMGIVVLGRLEGTVGELGDTLLRAVGVRIAPRGGHRLFSAGRRLDPASPLGSQGLSPLDRVDLVWDEGGAP